MAERINSDYRIIVYKKKASFYMVIPELNLITRGDDILCAYQNLEKAKKELFDKFNELGQEELIPQPLKENRLVFWGNLKDFLAKELIVCLTVILIIFATGAVFAVSLRQYLVRAQAAVTIESVERFAQRLRAISPERKKRLKDSLHSAVKELEPYSEELSPLFKQKSDLNR
ncbi:MAG: hypothetical protein PHT31_00905 [Candidatus Omnitrophica bacterium]|nr:hypothetical protein [Candidatus Omnitrophota bacterium]MDD5652704.1 hypothetical protein [Candidatus Omnitrophota bacterium]